MQSKLEVKDGDVNEGKRVEGRILIFQAFPHRTVFRSSIERWADGQKSLEM